MRLLRLRACVQRLPGPVVLLALWVAGCGYTSQYAAPADGRPRAVWRENNVVVDQAGAALSRMCLDEALYLTGGSVVRSTEGVYSINRPSDGYWAPRYYGPPILVVTPGLAPILPRPPVFLPGLFAARAVPRLIGPGSVAGSGLGLGRLGGGGGGGKGAGYAILLLAVLVLVTLPAIDLGLALAPPESPTKSSEAIDQVNALNDLLRSTGSPCAYGGAP